VTFAEVALSGRTPSLSLSQVARHYGVARSDVLALAQHCSGKPRTWWIARDDLPLQSIEIAPVVQHLCDLIERRQRGEPLAYLVGVREFYSHSFEVGPATLIPRPETEQLVDLGALLWRTLNQPQVLELGTGSGCIAISLAAKLRSLAPIVATEKSPEALAIAQRNANAILGAQHQIAWHLAQEWIDDDCPRCPLVLSNPPYISADDLHLGQGDLRFEPRMALTDESADGLTAISEILRGCAHWEPLRPTVLIEHGASQGLQTRTLAAGFGWDYTCTLVDDQGLDRILVASPRPEVLQVVKSAGPQLRG
jgi:release factor glutamine methyltransferase